MRALQARSAGTVRAAAVGEAAADAVAARIPEAGCPREPLTASQFLPRARAIRRVPIWVVNVPAVTPGQSIGTNARHFDGGIAGTTAHIQHAELAGRRTGGETRKVCGEVGARFAPNALRVEPVINRCKDFKQPGKIEEPHLEGF